jgi:glycogen debranching enzyme
VFDVGFPFCGVDLQAFLILQMDMLSRMAQLLGKRFEARQWTERADAHLNLMLKKLWDADAGQFRGFRAHTGEQEQVGNSLLDHMVMVLGERLPKEYGDQVVRFLEPDGKFITKYGPATEAIDSPKYLTSGYWRGPIWGSETVLLVDGLARGGYTQLAGEIARRYCDMCLQSMLFAENYDPLNGDPLCDKAYTWGSSAYLSLAKEYSGE